MKGLTFLFTVMLVAVMAFGIAGFAAAHNDGIAVVGMASDAGVEMPLVFSTVPGDQPASFTDHKSVKAGMSENHFIELTRIEVQTGAVFKKHSDGAGNVDLAPGAGSAIEGTYNIVSAYENATGAAHVLGGCTCFTFVKPATV